MFQFTSIHNKEAHLKSYIDCEKKKYFKAKFKNSECSFLPSIYNEIGEAL